MKFHIFQNCFFLIKTHGIIIKTTFRDFQEITYFVKNIFYPYKTRFRDFQKIVIFCQKCKKYVLYDIFIFSINSIIKKNIYIFDNIYI